METRRVMSRAIRRKGRAASLILLFAAAALGAPPVEDASSGPVISPRKVGERYRLDAGADTRMETRITADGKPAGDQIEAVTVRLIAVATVLAVDGGIPTRTRFLIDTCRKSSGGKTEEVLPAGSTLLVERKGADLAITVPGAGPLPPETRKLLDMVVPGKADASGAEQMLGQITGLRVGESRELPPAAIVAILSRNGAISVSPEGVKGTARLDRERSPGGGNFLTFSMRLGAEKLLVDSLEGLRVEKGSFAAEARAVVADEPQGRALLSKTLSMNFHLAVGGEADGTKLAGEISGQMTTDERYSPVSEPSPPETR